MAKPEQVQKTIQLFEKLGSFLTEFLAIKSTEKKAFQNEMQHDLYQRISYAKHHNAWFTEEEIDYCLATWSHVLTKDNLGHWLAPYSLPHPKSARIGLVLAGNVPLVGLHDLLCALVAGHSVIAKYSSKDQLLMEWVVQFFIHEDPSFGAKIQLTKETLKGFDAVIATGSNNTARYFEYYFRNKPHIIRKNRNSAAILTGDETTADFSNLAEDIFRYFGLGCRSVSKLWVPKEYDFTAFFEGIYHKKTLLQHDKYTSNYDYNKAVYLMSSEKLLDNGFIILKQDQGLSSPIGCLFYEYYSSTQELEARLDAQQDSLQCVVGNTSFSRYIDTEFGTSQQPHLWHYADGIDTMDFLLKL